MKTNTLKRENPKHGNAQGFKFVTSKVFYRYYAMNISISNSLKQELLLTDGVGLVAKRWGMSQHSHTTKLTNNVSKKSTSRFNVLTRSGRSIARKVPFSTAIGLKNAQPELFIKFDSMVGVV